MESYADAWIETYRSSKQWKSWGEDYLEALGPKIIKKMGYSFENLSQPFLSKRIGSKFALIPFDLAIKSSEKYTLADQMKVNTFKIHRYAETLIARFSSEMKNKTFKEEEYNL